MNKNRKLRVFENIILLAMVICFISILLVATVSCNISVVRGSGNVISEDRDVSGFSKISFSGSGTLYIEQGEKESLTIKAEDNLIPLIKTEISGNTLSIGNKLGTSIMPTKSMEFYLKVKDLDSISVSGSGSINCSGLVTDDLSIKTSGSSKVDLSNMETTRININSSGSSSYNLEGTTDSQDIKTSGSVKYFAGKLKSNSCVIDSSGSGQLEVNVSDNLDIKASGSTNITYIGNPTITQKISGSATISSK